MCGVGLPDTFCQFLRAPHAKLGTGARLGGTGNKGPCERSRAHPTPNLSTAQRATWCQPPSVRTPQWCFSTPCMGTHTRVWCWLSWWLQPRDPRFTPWQPEPCTPGRCEDTTSSAASPRDSGEHPGALEPPRANSWAALAAVPPAKPWYPSPHA